MSTEIGGRAEVAAARHLQGLGMKILARNYRDRWCEIDLIALDKGGGIHFAEVKYRRSNNYGSGFDYITPDKSHRLRRAALAWTAKYTPERSFQIDVISVSGDLETPLIDYLPNAVTE